MIQRVAYYLDTEEAKYVAEQLSKDPKFPKNVEFRELKSQRLIRLAKEIGSVFHPDQESFPLYSALIWGSGEDHDTSLIMSPLGVDFFKSVDDAHTDFGNKIDMMLSRTNERNHNSTLLFNYRHSRGVEVRGNLTFDKRDYECGPDKEPKSYMQHSGPSIVGNEKSRFVVHKSIDLDVIRDFPARYDWQNNEGSGKTLDELRSDLERVCKVSDIVRFDIGGLHFPTSEEEAEHYTNGTINPRKDEKALAFAVQCYKVLLETYFMNCK